MDPLSITPPTWGDRLHPLRHPDLLADSGVAQGSRAYFASDHPPRIEPYAHGQFNGISYQRFGPNAAMYYHGGEMPGFNSFMGYDPDNDVTLVMTSRW